MEFLIIPFFIALQIILAVDFSHQKELGKEVIVVLVVVIFLILLAYGRNWNLLRWLVHNEICTMFSLFFRMYE